MSGAIVNHLWQSTLVVAVVGLLTLVLRKNGAHIRHALWLAASIKFLIPLSLLAALATQLGAHHTSAIDSTATARVVQQITQPFDLSGPSANASDGARARRSTASSAEASSSVTALSFMRANASSILVAIWACGLIAVLIRWLVRWLGIRAAVRSAVPLPIDAPIPVMSVASYLEPGVVGIVRPTLLLPHGITQHLTPTELQAILAHELCHLRRHDNLTAAIHMLVEALFWFYPLVWWLGARLVAERERACDEAVLSGGNDPRIYAESILKVCRFYVASPVPCVSGVTGANLKQRIENIMTNRMAPALSFAKRALLAGVFGVLTLALYEATGSSAHAAVASAPSDKVLVLRDIPSWNRKPDFENVLQTLGLPTDVKPSAEMASVDLAKYNVVIIPGAQWETTFYKNFAASAAAFERYVSNGGTLVVELNGAEREGITLPGGPSMVMHGSMDNLITVPDHPILTPFAGKPRIFANMASHGYLTDVPAGALVLATEMKTGQVSGDMSKPTFIEYAYGKGHVIAAAQCFHDQDGSGRGALMPTLLKYAAARSWMAAASVPASSIAKAPPARVKVDPATLDRFVGHYQVGTIARILQVRRDGERLLTRMNARPEVEIFPDGNGQFFAKNWDMHYRFETGAEGEAPQVVMHQSGRDTTGQRMDSALAQQTLAALDARIHDNLPIPGSEAALRQHLAEVRAGNPDYERMSPELAAAVRVQLAGFRRQLDSKGSLQDVQFNKVEPDGSDLYDVRFEKGPARFWVALAPNGTIVGLRGNMSP